MKTKIILSFFLLFTSLSAFCTIWTVGNAGTSFTPNTITINPGDTVNFILDPSHNALEVSQSTWNIDDNTPLPGGFLTPYGGGLVLPAQLSIGTHYYVCEPHASMGMKAVIIVQSCSVPAQPIAISGNASICATTSNSYNIAAVSGA
ncbi:MAG: plastocyanin/azurin family copper-binding protein, partial [Bacteroidales bacterium]